MRYTKLALAGLLLFAAIPLHPLDLSDAIVLPAVAWQAWTQREQAIYILGVMHGELDAVIRIARNTSQPERAAFLPYVDYPNTVEQFAARLTQHIASLPSESKSTLFEALMAARWSIYPQELAE